MSKCCKKPKFKTELSPVYTEKYEYPSDTSGGKGTKQYQRYMIICENCGYLERKGIL